MLIRINGPEKIFLPFGIQSLKQSQNEEAQANGTEVPEPEEKVEEKRKGGEHIVTEQPEMLQLALKEYQLVVSCLSTQDQVNNLQPGTELAQFVARGKY